MLFETLKQLPNLVNLNINGNPVTKLFTFNMILCHEFPNIVWLDGKVILI